jgi:hypothetical protein
MMTLPTRSNIAFISADYRLAPQTNIHLILEDTVDAIEFVRKVLPETWGKDRPDQAGGLGRERGRLVGPLGRDPDQGAARSCRRPARHLYREHLSNHGGGHDVLYDKAEAGVVLV